VSKGIWLDLELWEPTRIEIQPYQSGELGARNEIVGYEVRVWFPRQMDPLVADARTVKQAIRDILRQKERP
jgi:hypothetical protein